MTDARIPRYQRIRDSVAQHIARQQWRVDQAIPTEAELARMHGVAVGTVRKAIDKLVAEGMIDRVHGKGMFVRRPDFSNSLFRFFRFQSGGAAVLPGSKILRRGKAEPPPDVRKQLNLGPKQKAIHLKRNRSWEDKVILIEDIWLPADQFDGILEAKLETLAPLLYPVYETMFGVLVARVEETLSVSQADAAIARALGISKGAPLLVIERVAFDNAGLPVEWRRSLAAAKGFKYKIEVR